MSEYQARINAFRDNMASSSDAYNNAMANAKEVAQNALLDKVGAHAEYMAKVGGQVAAASAMVHGGVRGYKNIKKTYDTYKSKQRAKQNGGGNQESKTPTQQSQDDTTGLNRQAATESGPAKPSEGPELDEDAEQLAGTQAKRQGPPKPEPEEGGDEGGGAVGRGEGDINQAIKSNTGNSMTNEELSESIKNQGFPKNAGESSADHIDRFANSDEGGPARPAAPSAPEPDIRPAEPAGPARPEPARAAPPKEQLADPEVDDLGLKNIGGDFGSGQTLGGKVVGESGGDVGQRITNIGYSPYDIEPAGGAARGAADDAIQAGRGTVDDAIQAGKGTVENVVSAGKSQIGDVLQNSQDFMGAAREGGESMVKELATRVGSSVAKTVGSDALAAVGGVAAEGIPIIGEIAGVGMLIHQLVKAHKEKTAAEQNPDKAVPVLEPQEEAGGFDPKALMGGSGSGTMMV